MLQTFAIVCKTYITKVASERYAITQKCLSQTAATDFCLPMSSAIGHRGFDANVVRVPSRSSTAFLVLITMAGPPHADATINGPKLTYIILGPSKRATQLKCIPRFFARLVYTSQRYPGIPFEGPESDLKFSKISTYRIHEYMLGGRGNRRIHLLCRPKRTVSAITPRRKNVFAGDDILPWSLQSCLPTY